MTRYKIGQGFSSLTVVMKREFHQVLHMTAAEIPFSIQLLKIQEPCPPFQMVSLGWPHWGRSMDIRAVGSLHKEITAAVGIAPEATC